MRVYFCCQETGCEIRQVELVNWQVDNSGYNSRIDFQFINWEDGERLARYISTRQDLRNLRTTFNGTQTQHPLDYAIKIHDDGFIVRSYGLNSTDFFIRDGGILISEHTQDFGYILYAVEQDNNRVHETGKEETEQKEFKNKMDSFAEEKHVFKKKQIKVICLGDI